MTSASLQVFTRSYQQAPVLLRCCILYACVLMCSKRRYMVVLSWLQHRPFLALLLVFLDWLPLCNSPGYSGTHFVDKAGLELIEIHLLLPSECWDKSGWNLEGYSQHRFDSLHCVISDNQKHKETAMLQLKPGANIFCDGELDSQRLSDSGIGLAGTYYGMPSSLEKDQ
ncbi:hypothetical protein H671_2g7187 [Cricetulus griseus]|uniref:Uncharacterized protein n=1 Tax=Cricetulus griseus TaxID=10029 RepID=A0A061IGM9_CRIGR|nr:hypothetical protein H671_2g7187 [Cricetulus griseus]